MRDDKLQPWGCDQQGRYPTRENPRYDHWGEYEWRDAMPTHRKPPPEPIKSPPPLTWGGALMAVAIVAAIAAFVWMGPWL